MPGNDAFFLVRNVDIIQRLDKIEKENLELKHQVLGLTTTFKVIGFFVAPALSAFISVTLGLLIGK